MIVYSTIYGGYDAPKPPRPHPAVFEWRLYTDDATIYAPGWNVVVESRPESHPRMKAKWRKCHPPPGRSLYLDASIRLRDPELIEHVLAKLDEATWVMYPHPERGSIAAEVAASAPMRKYEGLSERMRQQLADYGLVRGLWAGGIIGRASTTRVIDAGAAWFAECVKYTYQDQISLPHVLARHGIEVGALSLGGGLWQNSHFVVEPHRSDL